jgi:hypothetical protein
MKGADEVYVRSFTPFRMTTRRELVARRAAQDDAALLVSSAFSSSTASTGKLLHNRFRGFRARTPLTKPANNRVEV